MVTVEMGAVPGFVGVTFTAGADRVELVLTPEDARARGGGLGGSVGDVFADAVAMADHEDARQAARAHREAGLEPEHVMVGRSDGWPSSEYELERTLRRAEDMHRELVAYRARH